MSNRPRVLYHPREGVMGLWRDRNFPYDHFKNKNCTGWNVWIKLKYAKRAGWVLLGYLYSDKETEK